VTGDLPPGVVAAGVPARVIREIGEGDRLDVPRR
jgi:acetyltransferase-like isoleucine patch superfamily enzyme